MLRALGLVVTLSMLVLGKGGAAFASLPGEAGPALPFTLDELRTALVLRLPAEAEQPLVSVTPVDPDAVRISLNEQERIVPLGGRVGASAARLVALAVLDLTLTAVTPPAAPPSRRWSRSVLYILPTFGIGGEHDAALFSVDAGASLRIVSGLRGTIDFGYAGETPSVDYVGTAHAIDLRAGPGWLFRRIPLELRLSAIARPYWVVSTFGTFRDVSFGFGTAIFYYLPAGRRTRLVFSIGADLYGPQHNHYYSPSQLESFFLYRTEYVTVSAGLGVGFAP